MDTLLHVANVRVCGVFVLTVVDWVNKAVLEFLEGTQKIRLDKVEHTVVLDEVVLKGCAFKII